MEVLGTSQLDTARLFSYCKRRASDLIYVGIVNLKHYNVSRRLGRIALAGFADRQKS